MNDMNPIAALEGIALIAVYFLPIIVCRRRKSRNENMIFVVNLLFGWTIIGWLSALAWALDRSKKKKDIDDDSEDDDDTNEDHITQLERLVKLRDSGALSETEFQREKKKIVN